MQMSMGPRPVVHANQNQYRVERYRSESVRRHAVDLAVLVDRDDRNPGCETPHGLAEVASVKAHAETCCHRRKRPSWETFRSKFCLGVLDLNRSARIAKPGPEEHSGN